MIGSTLLLFGALVVALLTMLSVLQRCPHCRKAVRRARSRRWLRCRHCGRQYNRTVRPLTS